MEDGLGLEYLRYVKYHQRMVHHGIPKTCSTVDMNGKNISGRLLVTRFILPVQYKLMCLQTIENIGIDYWLYHFADD